MRQIINCLTILAAVYSISIAEQQNCDEYNVPLAFMTNSLDNKGNISEVFITFGESHEGCGISPGDDRYMKDSRRLRLDHIFRESFGQSQLLSPFEATVIDRVCKTFIETLEIFEKDLKGEKWAKCMYLDSYLSSFLKSFNYLLCAARESDDLLPAVTRIDDTLYDDKICSLKSHARIKSWQQDSSYIIKLRILSKELSYQITLWRKKELGNSKRDALEDCSGDVAKTLELFVRCYYIL
jgi:hypothetical protein